ncbi:MAG: permease [Candidatus Asgardarchaeum californiense]|nr:MAG: permease [Candidatus Asgardarchaeum californiense]
MESRKDSKWNRIVVSFSKAIKNFSLILPVLFGIILLLGLFKSYISQQMITSVFTGEISKDTILGSTLGSIFTGSPITSYIVGGELLKDGVSLLAVTAFVASWVTVGIIQLPAEAAILGKRFAITRNLLSFLFSMVIAVATVVTLEVVA